jgi:hypothetical protein
VPATTDDYGALLPLPSEPTLDPMPVDAGELERLDAATAPRILVREDDDGGSGCGCLGAGAAGSDKGAATPGPRVSEPVNIGPVTALVLSGEADSVGAWLSENGFTVSAADRATIARYVGYHFVAIRRNDRAIPGGPTSIGIHFTMQGDHREVPLRFASIGAAASVAVTLFLAVAEPAGPSPPFAALTLADLDAGLLRSNKYRQAVQDAVHARRDHAFVIESRSPRERLRQLDGTPLGRLIDANSTITRMSTIVPASALTEDALFHTPYENPVPNERYVRGPRPLGPHQLSIGSLATLLLARARRRARARRP